MCVLVCRVCRGGVDKARLEFLGRSVLSEAMSRYLYMHYREANEAELERMKLQLTGSLSITACLQSVSVGLSLCLDPSLTDKTCVVHIAVL